MFLERISARMRGKIRAMFCGGPAIHVSSLEAIPALPAGSKGHRMLSDAFLALISLIKPAVFCDIGANNGDVSRAVRRLKTGCRVCAFEANPEIHALFARDALADGVEWLNLAVTDCSGVTVPVWAPLKVFGNGLLGKIESIEPETTGKTSLLRRVDPAEYKRFDVKAVTLDEFFQPQIADSRTFFLWIDVEGAADKVLAGADKVLDKTLAIFIEVEGSAFWQEQKQCSEIVETIRRRGFVAIARDREYGDRQFNVLFVHKTAESSVREFLCKTKFPIAVEV